MTQNEVKHQLFAAMRAYSKYRTARDRADAYREQLTGKAERYEQGGGNSSKVNATEESLQRLLAYDEDTAQLERAWNEAREYVAAIISQCPIDGGATVLEYRYLNNYRYEEIAEVMGYSTRNIFKMHKKAIQYLSNIL